MPGRRLAEQQRHRVCPRQTRLRSGGIADLSLSRDAGEKDEVHAAWPVANPGNRHLVVNACRASLVAILDDNDGDPIVRSLSLGTRKAAFDQVRTGTLVPVQLTVVMEAADGDWLISDVLEQTLHQSLTKPASPPAGSA